MTHCEKLPPPSPIRPVLRPPPPIWPRLACPCAFRICLLAISRHRSNLARGEALPRGK